MGPPDEVAKAARPPEPGAARSRPPAAGARARSAPAPSPVKVVQPCGVPPGPVPSATPERPETNSASTPLTGNRAMTGGTLASRGLG
jgi:hypothetical protein